MEAHCGISPRVCTNDRTQTMLGLECITEMGNHSVALDRLRQVRPGSEQDHGGTYKLDGQITHDTNVVNS